MKKKLFLLLSALFALAVFFAPKQASAAEVTKNGTAIEVKNPTVQISGDATDLYARWGITFKVDIPDNIDINMNDTMTFKVNSPVKIQSSYSFPIYNKAGETVAYAEVSPESGNVTEMCIRDSSKELTGTRTSGGACGLIRSNAKNLTCP